MHYKAWRLWLVAFMAVSSVVGLLYLSWIEPTQIFGTAFSHLFNAESGAIYPALWMGLLFVAGQAAYLIGWARSRSLNDFRGAYKVWKYIGLTLILIAFGIAVRGDVVINATIELAKLDLPWSGAKLNWLIPTGIVAGILSLIIDREMRISRISRVHFWLAMPLIAMALSWSEFPQAPAVSALVLQGLLLSGLLLLCLSMMWYSRQVLYLSAEPAASSGRFGKLFAKLASLTKRHRSAESEDGSEELSEGEQAGGEKSARKSRRRGARKQTVRKVDETPKPEPVETEARPSIPMEQAKAAETPAVPLAKPRIQLKASDIAVSNIDEDILQERMDMMQLLAEEGEPLDQELLKGMTKKQKKQLRGYWRDLERQYAQKQAG